MSGVVRLLVVVASLCCVGGLVAANDSTNDGNDDAFLSNWMGEFASVWSSPRASPTLLDISVPGTHDSMTSDLSTTVSDNAEDVSPAVAYLLHTFSEYVPELGAFVRNQSTTQTLHMTAQLDAGMRFIDFRTECVHTAFSSSKKENICMNFIPSPRVVV